MARWKKNESVANKRSYLLAVYDGEGNLAPADTLWDADGELEVDPGTGVFGPGGGTLANVTKPLTVADFVFTADHTSDTLIKVAHTLLTGDGPLRPTNAGGGLPAGLVSGTNYWAIYVDDDTFQLAASLADALAGTAMPLTTNGTGVHTLSDVASTTKRLVKGHWRYTASQAELNADITYFAVKMDKDGYRVTTQVMDIYEKENEELAVAGVTYGDLHRGNMAILAGTATGYVEDEPVFKCPITGTTRWSFIEDETGRLVATKGTLT